jgi:hypothetical protein
VRADDDEDAEFYYDEEEVLAGAGCEDGARAAMLDHYDSLLQMPRADEFDEVRNLSHRPGRCRQCFKDPRLQRVP